MSIGRIIYKSLGLVFPISYLFLEKRFVLIFVGFVFLLFISLDVFRRGNQKFNQLLIKKISFIKKKEKKKNFTAVWLLIAVLIVVFFFSKEIAVVALFMWWAGDLSAGILGKKFNKIKLGEKSLEGHLICFVFALIAGLILAKLLNSSLLSYQLSFGALAAAIIQALPLKIDDNLTMPLAAAIVMSLL